MDETIPYNAFLDVVWGVNNGRKSFEFTFNAHTQAYDFIAMLDRLDKFLFDIDHSDTYIAVEFNGRTHK